MSRLVLVGGGHAHVEVLRSLAARPLPATHLTLITPARTSPYSGMLPGVIEGLYMRQDAEIDVAALARSVPDSTVVLGRVAGVDTHAQLVLVDGGPPVPYDFVSLDVGAAPGFARVPGAAEWTVPVKPVDALLDRVDVLLQRRHSSIVVVGGGPGGAELAAALAVRLGDGSRITLVCGGSLLPSLPSSAAAAVRARLTSLGVALLEADRVVRVEDGRLTTTTTTLPFDACLWCTGAAAPAWLGTGPNPPPLDAHGFIAVGASLACSDDPGSPLSRVFAVGDCAAVLPHPRPKAGVYAVRQGPPLDAALRAVVSGAGRPVPFKPQAAATALLSTGRKTAVGAVPLWGRASLPPLVVSGRWVWRLKDAIDRRFVARYRVRDQ